MLFIDLRMSIVVNQRYCLMKTWATEATIMRQMINKTLYAHSSSFQKL